ncbi:MAG TPA: hypothetical protein VIQ31_32300 [Phormidium sp.]
MTRIKVIVNSDEFNQKLCQTPEEALAYAETMKAKPHVVDILAYDYDLPLDQECFLYLAKIDGEWQNLT